MLKYLSVGAGCLIAGFFIGFFVSNDINRNAAGETNVPQNHADAPFQKPPTQQLNGVKEPNGAAQPDITATLEKAKKEPENFDAQMKAGAMYEKIQRADKASEFFNAAAALKPTEYEKIVQLGNAFFDVREFEKAANFYNQALEKKPEDISVRTDFGITFVERQNPDYDRAIKEFQTSLQTNPKHEPTLYNLAIAFYKKGDAENAQKYLAQLEQASPNSQLIGKLKELISQK